jgi:hypothetical protein
MPVLPNPFDSDAPVALRSDEAVASQSSQAPGATADISCIGEIFVGAAKLEPVEMWFENAAYPREDELLYEVLQAMDNPRAADLIEIPAGMWLEFDPLPLFLQQAV